MSSSALNSLSSVWATLTDVSLLMPSGPQNDPDTVGESLASQKDSDGYKAKHFQYAFFEA